MWGRSIACLERCEYCGTSIGHRFLGARPGYRYGDGRTICTDCHESAIKTAEQLQTVWQHVAHTFRQLGLSIKWPDIPVALLDKPVLSQTTGRDNCVGVATTAVSLLAIRSQISMLYGMPVQWAVETLAHEAGHVWCREQGIRFDPQDAEEGFCNVLGCLALRALKGRDTTLRQKAMFENPDPVYGQRFREQWALLENSGWQGYINSIIGLP